MEYGRNIYSLHKVHDLIAMNKKFTSWLAGFWEGEGSFSVSTTYTQKGTKVQCCVLQIAQANKEILDYIKAEVGYGAVYPVKKSKGKQMFNFAVAKREDLIKLVTELIPFTRFRTLQLQTKLKLVQDYYNNMVHKPWTKAELSFLRKNYKLSASEIALTIKRNPQNIRAMRKRLGLLRTKSHKYWTKEEESFLKVNYLAMKDKEIVRVLHGRKLRDIQEKRKRLGLMKTKGEKLNV